MTSTPVLIKAIDPADLTIQVHEYLEKGYDMHTPLFVNDDSLLCQFLVRRPCLYEYALIIANELDDFETHARNLVEMDFDFIFHTVMWHGKYVQWMCRMNESGMTVRDAVATTVFGSVTVAKRDDELQLVEDVRAGLRLAPLGDGALVSVPFPVNVS